MFTATPGTVGLLHVREQGHAAQNVRTEFTRETEVLDVLFVGLTIGLFAVLALIVRGVERL